MFPYKLKRNVVRLTQATYKLKQISKKERQEHIKRAIVMRIRLFFSFKNKTHKRNLFNFKIIIPSPLVAQDL